MNIFVTNLDPVDSAFALDDKRVIKMALESAQLMSTAINFYGGTSPYKPTHLNHPCSIWTRQSSSNYVWLFEHYKALCQAYYDRFGKRHKTLDYILELSNGVKLMPKHGLTSFMNCTTFKETYNVCVAYRFELCKKWKADKRPPKWTNSNPPVWAN